MLNKQDWKVHITHKTKVLIYWLMTFKSRVISQFNFALLFPGVYFIFQFWRWFSEAQNTSPISIFNEWGLFTATLVTTPVVLHCFFGQNWAFSDSFSSIYEAKSRTDLKLFFFKPKMACKMPLEIVFNTVIFNKEMQSKIICQLSCKLISSWPFFQLFRDFLD